MWTKEPVPLSIERHYIDIDDNVWKKIDERSKRIEESKGGSDFFTERFKKRY